MSKVIAPDCSSQHFQLFASPMICSFCSLLCEVDEQTPFACSRRTQALQKLDHLRRQSHTYSFEQHSRTQSRSSSEAVLRQLNTASHILITGRIQSVATARAAIKLASRWNATIDCDWDGHAFNSILPIQRTGVFTASIAEVRSHADLIIAIGDSSLWRQFPRLPESLLSTPNSPPSLLLLGQFEEGCIQTLRSIGFRPWSIECSLESVPAALRRFTHFVKSADATDLSTRSLMNDLLNARYTSLLWSPSCLPIDHADLWVESLLDWIAERNETGRCVGLPLATSQNTFHQVCTWLIGFPGRVQFREGGPDYDPYAHSAQRWLARFREDPNAVVLWIDESLEEQSHGTAGVPFLGWQNRIVVISPDASLFPISLPGAEQVSEMFRADQCILARVEPERISKLPSASYWLESFM
jgi:formylmethanofuran dehydrogenase subunit B